MQDETAAAGKSPGRIVKAHNLSPVKAPLNAIFGNMIYKRKTIFFYFLNSFNVHLPHK